MTDHEFVLDRIAEYLAGSLPEPERSPFESHLAGCASCAAELAAAQRMEKNMAHLFAPIAPPADFEDRLISRLRFGAPGLRISPVVRRAAIAASVALLLGGTGYVMNQQLQSGNLPLLAKFTSPSNQDDYFMGGHVQRRGAYGLTGRTITLSGNPPNTPAAQPPDSLYFGGGGNRDLNWSNWPDDEKKADSQRGKNNLLPQANQPWAMGRESSHIVTKDLPVEQSTTETHAYRSQMGNVSRTTSVIGSMINAPGAVKRLANASKQPEPNYFKPAEKEGDISESTAEPTAHPTQITEGVLGGTEDHPILQKQSQTPALVAATPTAAHAPVNASTPSSGQTTSPDAESTVEPSTQPSQKIIRNGEMEFEVDSFDSAAATISKVVGEEGGAVVTTNSEKLANGKVKGVVTVRVPPDHLDTLVLKLRALGDLKRQNLTAQDVTKQYIDTASELRADHAMEERLLNIIKTSQGQVKDLLAAEKELAVWREKIEKAEGEIRYYDNLVAMSTLTIQLSERDISNAAAATESENVDMGIEADDVEAARADAIKAIEDANGRIIESELKKLDAGQFAAKVVADIKPDAAGPVIDRLKQLGRVARLEMSRQQSTATGAAPDSTTRLVQGDTHLILSLYNLANIAPRQTTILNMASDDVETTYQSILARIAKAGGRVVTDNLNRQADQQTGGTIQAEVKSADADAVIADIRALGDVVRLNAEENPDTNNVTSAKRGISIELSSLASLLPREVNNRAIASADIAKSQQVLLAALGPMKARVIMSKLEDAGENHLDGYLDFEVRRADVDAAEKALAGIGETYERRVDTSADADNVTDAKVQFKVQIVQATSLPPRQTDTLAVEVTDVDSAARSIQSDATSLGGRVLDSSSSKDANSQMAKLTIEVPLARAGEILAKARQLGAVRTNQQSSNAQAPAGELARERMELTLASGEALVAPDQGILANIRHGLFISFTGLMWSLQLIVIGLCFVLPWAVLIWAVMRTVKRRNQPNVPATE